LSRALMKTVRRLILLSAFSFEMGKTKLLNIFFYEWMTLVQRYKFKEIEKLS
jgi:hypothetical protein